MCADAGDIGESGDDTGQDTGSTAAEDTGTGPQDTGSRYVKTGTCVWKLPDNETKCISGPAENGGFFNSDDPEGGKPHFSATGFPATS